MNPQETVEKIWNLCVDAEPYPRYHTFQAIAKLCHEQMETIDLAERWIAAHEEP